MIERLIELSLRNRVLVLILAGALAVVGIWSATRIAVDAIPDLSDTQVVVLVDYPGQAPQVVEDQVTNPLARALLSVPAARDVRGYSMFGVSFLYVLFDDGTDLYWARARVQEQLGTAAGSLPAGAEARLGPDATGVGWIFQYVLVTGRTSPAHPNGFWHDPRKDRWYPAGEDLPADPRVRQRLVRHRVFPENERDRCPISGERLVDPDVDLAELRSLQDWFLRYELSSLEGVAEVAAVGGHRKQYQVTVDPETLLALGLDVATIAGAVRAANLETGGRSIEIGETEYVVRAHGYLGGSAARPEAFLERSRETTRSVVRDLKTVVLGVGPGGSPILLGDIARIEVGPDIRQGIASWNDRGEAIGGIVVMRHGENARATISRVRDRLAELESSLPAGVGLETAYDRSDLIDRSIRTLNRTLFKEMLAVTLVMIVFLLHVRSALVAALVLPSAVMGSIALMHALGINANIMSLGGIAIAVGVMVDCSIVMVENAHRHFANEETARAEGGQATPHAEVIARAAREVGPTLFFSLLVITVSFLPVFLLGEQSGRLFKPLAFTKTFAMAWAALLAVTLTPVLMHYFVKERVLPEAWRSWARTVFIFGLAGLPGLALWLLPPWLPTGWAPWVAAAWAVLVLVLLLPQRFVAEERHLLNRGLEAAYGVCLRAALRFSWPVLLVAVALVALTFWGPFRQLGTEFMPPLEEGDLLYMPTTVEPGLSLTKARELLLQTDRLIHAFPEVASVHGKIGRADTATDPAPLNMIETTIILHRDPRQWRHVPRERFFTDWPGWARRLPAMIWSESRPITQDELIYGFTLPDGTHIPGLDTAVNLPGVANAWTMPIRARIDMLSTGIRTPVGVKLLGPDLETLSRLATDVEQLLQTNEVLGPHITSAYAERTVGGKYLSIDPDREALARHGISIASLHDTISLAIGGATLTETVEGVERYGVNLRYARDWRENLPRLGGVLVAAPTGAQVPLEDLAELRLEPGPPMIRSENARPTAWVYVDFTGIDVGSFVDQARRTVARELVLPEGYSLVWSGQYEYIETARAQFAVAIPLTLLGIMVLLYLATRSWLRVLLVLTTLSFSVIGAIWLVWLLDYNLSVAVLIGIIALLGLDAETSLIMLLYLDRSYDKHRKAGTLRQPGGLLAAIYEGAVLRMRPKTMTVLTTIVGLLPLMFATGAGADTMRRLAAPMVGGLVTSFLMELILYPVIYYLARQWQQRRK
ncbi:MAG: efflux RND transporter permease subunit [Puniceicoccaceae bacterium]|nr:MAG: efflux RND transporter permease subunit [Puniceicoccaceae bacterium]